MAGQLKNGFMKALAVTFATALSGCAEEEVRPQVREQYVIDIVRDECGLSGIVKDYYETDTSRNGRSYSSDFFRQDKDSLTRTAHRGHDWNLLDYIIRDERFEFKTGCRSDFSRQQLINISEYGPALEPEWQSNQKGMKRYGDVFEHHFRSDQSRLLCYLTPVPGRTVDQNAPGQVQSCIDVRSGAKTFDVLHDN